MSIIFIVNESIERIVFGQVSFTHTHTHSHSHTHTHTHTCKVTNERKIVLSEAVASRDCLNFSGLHHKYVVPPSPNAPYSDSDGWWSILPPPPPTHTPPASRPSPPPRLFVCLLSCKQSALSLPPWFCCAAFCRWFMSAFVLQLVVIGCGWLIPLRTVVESDNSNRNEMSKL